MEQQIKEFLFTGLTEEQKFMLSSYLSSGQHEDATNDKIYPVISFGNTLIGLPSAPPSKNITIKAGAFSKETCTTGKNN